MVKWISVEDRLPAPLANVLAHYAGGRIDIDWVGHDGEWMYENSFGKVTHWMQLPEPPKGKLSGGLKCACLKGETSVKGEISMEVKKLNDTVALMESADYRERFKAEYYQVAIRYQKLVDMLARWDAGELSFRPMCPRSTYSMQIAVMAEYMAVLEARAVMEDVAL